MPSWLLKAAAQGAISLLPGRHRLNRLLQEHVTGSVALTQRGFEAKVAQCRHHLLSFHREFGSDRGPHTALELGTGWYPIVPVGLALAGVERVTTVDVTALLERTRTARVLELYADALAEGRLAGALPGVDVARAQALLEAARGLRAADPAETLAAMGVSVFVGDTRALTLVRGSVELFVSNNTLEHIPPAPLAEILARCHRLAAKGAVMDHFIDLSDHYAHFDASISEFNYLRFPPAWWRVFNNRLQYQNRLRVSDYRRLLERSGFCVVSEESERGSPSDLARLDLAGPFRRYEQPDLLVLRSWLTAVAQG